MKGPTTDVFDRGPRAANQDQTRPRTEEYRACASGSGVALARQAYMYQNFMLGTHTVRFPVRRAPYGSLLLPHKQPQHRRRGRVLIAKRYASPDFRPGKAIQMARAHRGQTGHRCSRSSIVVDATALPTGHWRPYLIAETTPSIIHPMASIDLFEYRIWVSCWTIAECNQLGCLYGVLIVSVRDRCGRMGSIAEPVPDSCEYRAGPRLASRVNGSSSGRRHRAHPLYRRHRGPPGQECVARLLPGLRAQHKLDLVIANGENAAGGFGLSPKTAQEILDAGVEVITLGNHTWAQKEIIPYLDTDVPVIRPLNYPPRNTRQRMAPRAHRAGHGYCHCQHNGTCFYGPAGQPFSCGGHSSGGTRGLHTRGCRLPRGGDERESSYGELSGRAGECCARYPHPRAHRRRAGVARRHAVRHGRWNGGSIQLRHWRGDRGDGPPLRYPLPVRKNRRDQIEGPVSFNAVLLEIDPGTGRGRSIRRIDILDEPPAER